jgi:predicted metal-dependent HD superfamily phosphohydrolase
MTCRDSARRERLRLRWEKLLPTRSSQRILDAYDHPSRGYHNLEHLEEVLEWTDRVPLSESDCDGLRLALFYHDAIYDSYRSDNEQASADWAVSDLGAQADRLVPLILDTRHAAQPSSELGAWMVDIDLAILGADPARFDRYQVDVRHEYAWVPGWLYRLKRGSLLRQFLARPQLYYTVYFRELLESSARSNLRRALAAL